jgi:hypothetical protein
MADDEQPVDLRVRSELGTLLMLRSSVAPFFKKIAGLSASRVIVDFSNVEFMSRSFADEYLHARASCSKRLEERHISPEVRAMLDRVSRSLGSHPSRSTQSMIREPAKVLQATIL